MSEFCRKCSGPLDFEDLAENIEIAATGRNLARRNLCYLCKQELLEEQLEREKDRAIQRLVDEEGMTRTAATDAVERVLAENEAILAQERAEKAEQAAREREEFLQRLRPYYGYALYACAVSVLIDACAKQQPVWGIVGAVALFFAGRYYYRKYRGVQSQASNPVTRVAKTTEEMHTPSPASIPPKNKADKHREAPETVRRERADVNGRNSNDHTKLIAACAKGQIDKVKLLLAAGLDINTSGKTGFTALIAASEEGQIETVKYLLDQGADVGAKNQVGFTALMRAAYSEHADVVEILLDAGADVNATNIAGQTALIAVSMEGLNEIVKILLNRGADPNIGLEDGHTALMLACKEGHDDVAKLLLHHGADVNATREDGGTAFMIASVYGNTGAMQLLLNNRADVNAKNHKGLTALMLASYYGYVDAVRFLLANGADLHVKALDDYTALTLASERGHDEVVRVLSSQQPAVRDGPKDKGLGTAKSTSSGRDTPTRPIANPDRKKVKAQRSPIEIPGDESDQAIDPCTPARPEAKPTISASKALKDIHAGLSDAQIMEKYGLSAKGLQSLFSKLLQMNLVTQAALDSRNKDGKNQGQISAREVVRDVKSGMSDLELMTKHDLSPRRLANLFVKLINVGYVTQADLVSRQTPRKLEGTVDLSTESAAARDSLGSSHPKGVRPNKDKK